MTINKTTALIEAAKWCADDLEAMVEDKYSGTKYTYPSEARKYGQGIAPVKAVREALAAFEQSVVRDCAIGELQFHPGEVVYVPPPAVRELSVEEVAEIVRLEMTTPQLRHATRHKNIAKALATLGTIRVVEGRV